MLSKWGAISSGLAMVTKLHTRRGVDVQWMTQLLAVTLTATVMA